MLPSQTIRSLVCLTGLSSGLNDLSSLVLLFLVKRGGDSETVGDLSGEGEKADSLLRKSFLSFRSCCGDLKELEGRRATGDNFS